MTTIKSVTLGEFYDETGIIIEYRTTVNDIKIYRLIDDDVKDCDRYFSTNVKYLGIVKDNIFYIIELYKDDLTDNRVIMDIIGTLTPEHIRILSKSIPELNEYDKEFFNIINKWFRDNIKNFKFITLDRLICLEPIDLIPAKRYIRGLNKKLNCSEYNLGINYVFYLKDYTNITAFDYRSDSIILCIFKEQKCISSIVFEIDDNIISIDSKTHSDYEGRKMNKLLRAISIMIAPKLVPNVKYIKSVAINPISAHLMLKYFKAIPVGININEVNTPEKIKAYIDENYRLITQVPINEETIQNARDIFDTIVKDFECTKKGGSRKTKKGSSRKTQKGGYRKTQKYKHSMN